MFRPSDESPWSKGLLSLSVSTLPLSFPLRLLSCIHSAYSWPTEYPLHRSFLTFCVGLRLFAFSCSSQGCRRSSLKRMCVTGLMTAAYAQPCRASWHGRCSSQPCSPGLCLHPHSCLHWLPEGEEEKKPPSIILVDWFNDVNIQKSGAGSVKASVKKAMILFPFCAAVHHLTSCGITGGFSGGGEEMESKEGRFSRLKISRSFAKI